MEEGEQAKAMHEMARAALAASYELAALATAKKDLALARMADLLMDGAQRAKLKQANAEDLAAGQAAGLSAAMLDRLRLTPARLDAMVQGIREVIALPDPVGEVLEERRHPSGFLQRKVRVPIGVIGIIYESRPNVTIDCAVLCLKSGNATILRGGREALHSNRALAELISMALASTGLPPAAVQLVGTTDRSALTELLKLDNYIHCLIPRGGEGLIRFVSEHARMPVIKHYKGVCNIYMDAAADEAMAVDIVVNAKCQRPSVCNAAENLLVHRSRLNDGFVAVARSLHNEGVQLRCDADALEVLAANGIPACAASAADFDTEYLDKILSIATVDSIEAAVSFINLHGSGHSDAIITADAAAAHRFLAEVDAAAVYWNVSTRFTDGFEFGLGAEIGISTDKLHARGPMGLKELTSYKFLLTGNGEVRT
jgi:glutamate-5-semialdehyde dehydrogenase